ncbi:FtsB family cell division protein [Rhodobium gokarnense]|uniref:Cell division protein FtsB n=1 Tax=Rhodobium gokarnense TaxID=364296 RepID=A0ABT3HB23_9HYPH|nr:septum formation initiator family protein [Rhodobium gokarnense]MCW2307597.1 cell division protein FtsB [Rhodobium gokarnense]
MATRHRRKTVLQQLYLPAITVMFLAYFAYHAFHGDYGLFARERFDSEAAHLGEELADLKATKEKLERRVALLRPESLDPDMIEERARESLNVVHQDEVVIFRDHIR